MWLLNVVSRNRLLFAFTLFVVSFVFTLLVMPYRPRRHSVIPTTDTHASNKRLNVILISEPRSGSSFTGKVFEEHDDVFYLYEPLFHFLPLKAKAKESPETQKRYNAAVSSFLRSIFTCSFNDSVYLEELKTTRNKMRCPAFTNTARLLWVSQSCRVPLSRQNFEDICKRRKFTVAKFLITRLPGVINPATKDLTSLCNSSSDFECLLVYLVRDPRAVVSSLLNIGFFDKQKENFLKSGKYSKEYMLTLVEPRVKTICRTAQENIKYIRGLSTRLGKKILTLRYEDLASAPQIVIEDLYDFVGLQMTRNIAQWIRKNTRPAKEDTKRNANKPYSTVRNSLEVLTKWRRSEQLYVVQIIEDVCEEVMGRLGYIPVKGSEDMLRNLTIPLFTKHSPLLET